jgi:hypothetical protein
MWIYAPHSCAAAGAAGAVEALLRCLVAGVPSPPRDCPSDLVARALEQWMREGGGGGGSGGEGGSGGGGGGGGGRGGGDGSSSSNGAGVDTQREVFSATSGADGGGGEGISQTIPSKRKGPPVMIAFPEGRGDDGESPRAMSVAWEVDDPAKEFGQPSEDEVRCEALEALLTLLAEVGPCPGFRVQGLGFRV